MRVRVLGAATAAAALLLVGCGGDSDSSATPSPTMSETSAAPSPSETASTPAASGTIVDLAVATPDLSTLVTAVKAAGLVETLSGTGPFTVFAPTNAAFAALPAGVLDKLVKPENKAALTSILTYHVVADAAVKAADVKAGDVKTVNGESLTLGTTGGVTVNTAKVVTPDVVASNGVVHVIDAVLLPKGFDPATLK
jgi:uncharacterized surface protein with fasciclin (FAS1) repeats